MLTPTLSGREACGLFSTPNPTPASIQPTVTPAPPTDMPTPPPPTATLPPPSPRPTITPSPPPEWVTDFAEPILVYIAKKQPTFEDDFEQPSEDWAYAPGMNAGADPVNKYEIKNGKLYVSFEAYRRGFQFDDYVVEVDAQSQRNTDHGLGFNFRQGSCIFWVFHDLHMEASCWDIASRGHGGPVGNIKKAIDNIGNNSMLHLRLIAKGTYFAFYVNGNPMGYFEHEFLNTGNAMLNPGIYDNFKVWDISDLNIP
jgi:hypothetical protein